MKYLRSVGHGLHTTSNHDTALAESDVLSCERDGLHTGSAHLVDGGGLGGLRASCLKSHLTSGSLADVALQNVTHVDLLDLVGLEAGALDGSLDSHYTELRSGGLLKHTVERADGRSGGGNDENVVDLRLSFAPIRATNKTHQVRVSHRCLWGNLTTAVRIGLSSRIQMRVAGRTMILAVWESRATAVW